MHQVLFSQKNQEGMEKEKASSLANAYLIYSVKACTFHYIEKH